MIRIAMVTDKNNTIGHSNLDDYFERAREWSVDLINEINKIFEGDSMAVGNTTLPLCLDYVPKYNRFYVLSHEKLSSDSNNSITYINDYKKLINKYQFADEILTIGGGKSIWKLFLPYASELIICTTDEDSSGDITYSEWTSLDKRLTKTVKWNGGKTKYYSMNY